MKRLLLALCLILSLVSTSNAVVTNYSKYTCLTGGTADCLDSQDGASLLDNDRAYVAVSGVIYFYRLNASSGAAESSPNIISPDTNAGNKRWILQKISLTDMENLASNSIIGNNTGGAATPLALTVAQVKTLLAIAQADVSGLTTASTPTFAGVNLGDTNMNDYKEATWTPALTFGGGSTGITYDSQVGRYTRIGNTVFFKVYLDLSSKGSSAGLATVSMPVASTQMAVTCSVAIDNTDASLGAAFTLGYIDSGVSVINLKYMASSGWVNIADTHLTNASVIVITGFYEVN